jgi:hypothetical protein
MTLRIFLNGKRYGLEHVTIILSFLCSFPVKTPGIFPDGIHSPSTLQHFGRIHPLCAFSGIDPLRNKFFLRTTGRNMFLSGRGRMTVQKTRIPFLCIISSSKLCTSFLFHPGLSNFVF